MKRVLFVPRTVAEAVEHTPHRRLGVISITTPGDGEAELHDGWVAVMRLAFDDVDAPEGADVAFDALMARDIVLWVFAHKDEIDMLIVHCDAGISRSAAVAKWVAETFGLPFPEGYPLYNKRVYRMLVEAARWEEEGCDGKY